MGKRETEAVIGREKSGHNREGKQRDMEVGGEINQECGTGEHRIPSQTCSSPAAGTGLLIQGQQDAAAEAALACQAPFPAHHIQLGPGRACCSGERGTEGQSQ